MRRALGISSVSWDASFVAKIITILFITVSRRSSSTSSKVGTQRLVQSFSTEKKSQMESHPFHSAQHHSSAKNFRMSLFPCFPTHRLPLYRPSPRTIGLSHLPIER